MRIAYQVKEHPRLVKTLGAMLIFIALMIGACSPESATALPAEETAEQEETAAEADESSAESGSTCPAVTVADMDGLESKYPQQFDLAEFEAAADCEMVFSDNPLFAEEVASGGLPPVAERLPSEPLVVAPYDTIGTFGGQLQLVSLAPESGTAENLSYRHVQFVRYSDDLQTIVPDVAKSWEWNEDYSELTFTLRAGHRWSDGSPFTADDILFWYYDIQLNAELFPSPRDLWKTEGQLMEIEKIDDLTVRFDFGVPRPGALVMFATSYIQPWQPMEFLSQFHIDYNPDANTLAEEEGFDNWTMLFRSYYHDWKDSFHRTGVPTLEPYMLYNEDTEQRTVIANPYYFKVDTAGQQLPYINEQREVFISDLELINLKIIAGEVDLKSNALSLTNYPLFKENEEAGNYHIDLASGGLAGGMGYTLNITHEDPFLRDILSDIRFKQALSLAINRDDINETVFLGLGTPMQFTPADPVFVDFVTEEQSQTYAAYDPEMANQLLDEMGLEMGSDGFRTRPDGDPLVLYMDYTILGGPALTHELVQQYWEAVGIKVELEEVSTEAFRTRNMSNEHDVYVWRTDGTAAPSLIADPYSAFIPFQASGLQVRTGLPWGQYWATDGAEGEEPPEWAEQLREDAVEFGSLMPYTDEWKTLGQSIVQQWLDQLITIGTVGDVPVPFIVSNRLGNVPTIKTQIWDYYCIFPFRIDQAYVK